MYIMHALFSSCQPAAKLVCVNAVIVAGWQLAFTSFCGCGKKERTPRARREAQRNLETQDTVDTMRQGRAGVTTSLHETMTACIRTDNITQKQRILYLQVRMSDHWVLMGYKQKHANAFKGEKARTRV